MASPSVRNLPGDLKHVAEVVAQRLADRGHRAWLVGGAVRDLVLEREVHDVDMVSRARPDEIEQAFESTIPVGKAFGTVVVPIGGFEVQVATFRSETGYSDRRRPDRVAFGATLEEDAMRRDFTCNALYLDPLTDELRDPSGGAADLEQGVLRTVGDAAARFREDGLRLMRLARFEAALDLAPAPGLHAAARAEAAALAGVSVERILGELTRVFEGPRSPRALAVLAECEVLSRILPGAPAGEDLARRLEVHGRLPDPPGAALGLACWLGPALTRGAGEPDPRADPDGAAAGRAAELRVSRQLARALGEIWRLVPAVRELATGGSRAQRIRAMRSTAWGDALELARAWQPELGPRLDEMEEERVRLAPEELQPEPWITSEDLAASSIPRGPRWGALLEEAERLQLDRAWRSRDDALAWLRGQA